jgi:hypothetical protein
VRKIGEEHDGKWSCDALYVMVRTLPFCSSQIWWGGNMVRFPHGKQYLFFFYNPGVEIKLLGAWQLYREQNMEAGAANLL